MQNETLARRYSAALYKLASKTSEVYSQDKELKMIKQLLAEHSELRRALESPTVAVGTKKNIVRDLLQSKVNERTLNFMYLLIDKGRESYFDQIADAFEQHLKNDRGVIDVRVDVAAPLDPLLETLVMTRLVEITGKKVEMQVKVDPKLVAGVVITMGDRLYDGSVKHHLDEIRERLSTGK